MDEEIVLGKDTEYPLGGTLSIPDGCAGKVPALVLVQGSGPSDRDETVHQNKPFRDITEHIVGKGIAVLRYDKRTYIHAGRMADANVSRTLTIREEMIEDALLATRMLKDDSRIDSRKVFILGHSLGGQMAPRIDAEGGDFAGLVIFAGTPRNLSDVLVGQGDELVSLMGPISRFIAGRQVAGLRRKFDAIKGMTDVEAQNTRIFENTYAYYFKELNEHPVSDYLPEMTKPVLIMQGDKDAHVTVGKDFNAYRDMCSHMSNVRFILYPGLNHLFMDSVYGNIKNLRNEYKVPNRVRTEVLDDIVEWIFGN